MVRDVVRVGCSKPDPLLETWQVGCMNSPSCMDGEVAIILLLLLFIACFSTAALDCLVYVGSKKITDGSERVKKPLCGRGTTRHKKHIGFERVLV